LVLTVAAGEDWDPLVERCVADSLSGLECLSGIPGLVGATPIQHVGAYGQEVAETIVTVRAYDRARDLVVEMANADCGFGYRTSAFKRGAMVAAQRAGLAGPDWAGPAGAGLPGPGPAGPGSELSGPVSELSGPVSELSGPVSPTLATGRFVVLGVTFRLSRDPLSWPLRYGELASSLGIEPGGRVPLADVRAAVLRLRRRKGMVLDPDDPDTRSAGSFFTNPVLDPAQFAALEQAVAVACGPGAQVPRYAAEAGQVKVSAAWLIEKAGFSKGYPGDRSGQAHGPRISTKHTLALVNPGGSSTKELLDLAAEITNGVREIFGVELVREPVLVAAG